MRIGAYACDWDDGSCGDRIDEDDARFYGWLIVDRYEHYCETHALKLREVAQHLEDLYQEALYEEGLRNGKAQPMKQEQALL